MKTKAFTIPEREGYERASALVVIPTAHSHVTYRCVKWEIAPHCWTLELADGNQVEVHNPDMILLHIAPPGFTFELDGTCREVKSTSVLVVN